MRKFIFSIIAAGSILIAVISTASALRFSAAFQQNCAANMAGGLAPATETAFLRLQTRSYLVRRHRGAWWGLRDRRQPLNQTRGVRALGRKREFGS
jgi:hypothetical protein